MTEEPMVSNAMPPASSGSPADDAARRDALDPEASLIVQAPAGSGKTALLIQRLLVLLARVERPEEVVAITFTRKAAGEMRDRLLEVLTTAASEPGPGIGAEEKDVDEKDVDEEAGGEDYQSQLRRRARVVLKRDEAKGWRLLETPSRLRILTFDAFCAQQVQQSPVASGMGRHPGISEAPEVLYRDAARATLADLENGGRVGDALERLLWHLDNDLIRCERLLVTLLAKRDQWLRHIALDQPANSEQTALWRQALEAELRGVVTGRLTALREAFSHLLQHAGVGASALGEEARHAATLVAHAMPTSSIIQLEDMGAAGSGDLPPAETSALPPAEPQALPQWKGLAELLLTAGSDWRKTLTKNQGFPSDAALGDKEEQKQRKARMKGILDALREVSSADAGPFGDVPTALARAANLPHGVFHDSQWAVMEALLIILPRAVTHLDSVFAREGVTDYMAVAGAAQKVIVARAAQNERASDGSENELLQEGMPRHLLVDEFQDTSRAQFELLLQLIRTWPTDGSSTLFLVGDPMQSIYRFREADVGLFLRARHGGIGQVSLRALTLTENFRSRPDLVNWVNDVFPTVMAREEDVQTGAVRFSASTPHRQEKDGRTEGAKPSTLVQVHPLIQSTGNAEGGRSRIYEEERDIIVSLIRAHLADAASGTLAVLVRARSHLGAIVPALVEAGLPFRAVDIDALTDRQVIHDMLSLTRALISTADRVAWLAVLRAPWCGLSLADLHTLCNTHQDPSSLWERLRSGPPEGMSSEGERRAARLIDALAPALAHRGRRPLRRWVESAWLALGGPACLSPVESDHASRFLDLLEGISNSPLPDLDLVDVGLARLFAAPDPSADGRVQVMSIHKSKGLEFDTVILPGLGRAGRGEDSPLLRWLERPVAAEGGNGLLVAPIQATGGDHDPVYNLLAEIEKDKAHHELGRLLYVAVTRARERLHLVGHAATNDSGLAAPGKNTLLGVIWPSVASRFEQGLAAQDAGQENAERMEGDVALDNRLEEAAYLRRLPADWRRPEAPRSLVGLKEDLVDNRSEDMKRRVFDWATESARAVGSVTHRLLCLLAVGDGGSESLAGLGDLNDEAVKASLAGEGVPADRLEAASDRVRRAVEGSLNDPRGRWVLSPHAQANSEFAVTVVLEGRPKRLIIDRTFIDEDGVRWIVDYKTSHHGGGSLEDFLDNEMREYRAQLEQYAEVMRRLDPGREIRLALYFPLHAAWREWSPENPEAG